MLQKYKSKREEGFTIIEVLIVLAIAGLILLIVFLAVPALQRNSRNTGRKNDVARAGGAAQEFINNNNGRIPVAGDSGTIIGQIGATGQYDFVAVPGNFIIATQATVGTGTITNVAQMRLVTGAQCNNTAAGQVVGGSNNRQLAIQYAVEDANGGAGTAVCQDI